MTNKQDPPTPKGYGAASALEALESLERVRRGSRWYNIYIPNRRIIETIRQALQAQKSGENIRDQKHRYLNATRQVQSFNEWRIAGFPDQWPLPEPPEVSDG